MSTSYKGHTWGKIDLSEKTLRLCTMDETPKIIFGFEFESINNAIINKSDIVIESGAQIQDDEDCLCEVRFHVDLPKEQNQMNDQSDENSEGNENKDGEAEENKKQKDPYSQNLYKQIIEKAKIGAFAGESILTLNQVNLAVPRGKYTIDFYTKNLRFHGQTYNFTIDYKNIIKGFLLPMENQSQVSIILQLHKDKPIYQGQTLYRNIVVQIKKDVEIEAKTKVKDKDLQKNASLTKLKEEYSGPLFEVLMQLLKVTSSVNFIAPDLNDYKSKNGQSCVKCGVKAQTGWLYFLKKSLIFIPKPVFYFKVDEIKKVEFSRLGANNKQFDMKVTLSDDDKKKEVEFMNIERNELQLLIDYFKSKNVKVQMEEDMQKAKVDLAGVEDQDSEQDADFDGQGMSDDDDDDDDEDSSSGSHSQNANKGKNGKKGKDDDKKQSKAEENE